MKIAVIDPAAYSLPYDTHLCRALAAAGHDVTLFTTDFAHGEMPDADGFTIDRHFYTTSFPGLSRRIERGLQHPIDLARLLRRLRREGFAIAHVQWMVMPSVERHIYAHSSVPLTLTVHNALPREGDRFPVDPSVMGTTFAWVIAHSEAGVRRLVAHGSPDNRTRHIEHGILDIYQPDPDMDDDAIARALPPELAAVDDTARLIVLPGLLRPYKGVDVMLAAWPGIHRRHPDAHLVIAGRPMGVTLPTTPPAGATFVPRFLDDDELRALLTAAHAVTLPYTEIDLSGVLFAAIAAQTPMVLSDVGGFSEFDGQGAVMAQPGDSQSVAEAVSMLLADDTRHHAITQQVQALHAGRYAWDRIAQKYDRMYADTGLTTDGRRRQRS